MSAAFIDGFRFSCELLAVLAGLCTPLIMACCLFMCVLNGRLPRFLFGRRLKDRA